MTSSMRWKAICSRGSSSMTPGGVRGLIKRKTPAPGGLRRDAGFYRAGGRRRHGNALRAIMYTPPKRVFQRWRSEEHTSELQSRENLVCRLLLEKKKKNKQNTVLL